MVLESQVGVHTLQPRQFVLDILQVPQLRYLHARIPGLPHVVRRLADPMLATGLPDLRPGLDLFEDADYLLFAELRLLHTDLLWGSATFDRTELLRALPELINAGIYVLAEVRPLHGGLLLGRTLFLIASNER